MLELVGYRLMRLDGLQLVIQLRSFGVINGDLIALMFDLDIDETLSDGLHVGMRLLTLLQLQFLLQQRKYYGHDLDP